MMQPISFMGREECLTKPAKKVVTDFVGDGAIIKDTSLKVEKTLNDYAAKEANKINEAFQAKYAPYVAEKPNSSEVSAELANSWAKSHYGNTSTQV